MAREPGAEAATAAAERPGMNLAGEPAGVDMRSADLADMGEEQLQPSEEAEE